MGSSKQKKLMRRDITTLLVGHQANVRRGFHSDSAPVSHSTFPLRRLCSYRDALFESLEGQHVQLYRFTCTPFARCKCVCRLVSFMFRFNLQLRCCTILGRESLLDSRVSVYACIYSWVLMLNHARRSHVCIRDLLSSGNVERVRLHHPDFPLEHLSAPSRSSHFSF
jgi:hypothetical protein